MSSSAIPDGFTRHTRRSGLTDPWEPLYAMQRADGLYAPPRRMPTAVDLCTAA